MSETSYISVRSSDGSETIFPALRSPAFTTKHINLLIHPTKVKQNRLVLRRKDEMMKSRLARIESKPQFIAAAVTRYSSQALPMAATPSTPPSPDEPEEPEDLLVLGRVVKRGRSMAQRPLTQVMKVVKHPEAGAGRLSSIKT